MKCTKLVVSILFIVFCSNVFSSQASSRVDQLLEELRSAGISDDLLRRTNDAIAEFQEDMRGLEDVLNFNQEQMETLLSEMQATEQTSSDFLRSLRDYQGDTDLEALASFLQDGNDGQNGLIEQTENMCRNACQSDNPTTCHSNCERQTQRYNQALSSYLSDYQSNNPNIERIRRDSYQLLQHIVADQEGHSRTYQSHLAARRGEIRNRIKELEDSRNEVLQDIGVLRESIIEGGIADMSGVFDEIADSFKRDTDSNLIDSKLLMIDSMYLESEFGLSDFRIRNLMSDLLDHFSDQLDQTLLGQYIDNKISEAIEGNNEALSSDDMSRLVNQAVSEICQRRSAGQCAPESAVINDSARDASGIADFFMRTLEERTREAESR